MPGFAPVATKQGTVQPDAGNSALMGLATATPPPLRLSAQIHGAAARRGPPRARLPVPAAQPPTTRRLLWAPLSEVGAQPESSNCTCTDERTHTQLPTDAQPLI